MEKCPYCNAEIEIRHEDGYGYEEDEIHQQECYECGKTFGFTHQTIHSDDVFKLDCANGAEHKWEKKIGYPKEYYFGKYHCKDCGEIKQEPLTEEEKEKYKNFLNN